MPRFCRPNRALSSWAVCLLLALCPLLATVQRYFLRSHDREESLRHARIGVIYQDRQGYLWIGSEQGLYRYDGFSYKAYPLGERAEQSKVTAIYESRSGELWIGYSDGAIGILQYNMLRAWSPEEGLPRVAVTGFAEDRSGQLWIATYGEGMYVRSGRRLYQLGAEDGLGQSEIYASIADERGRIWAATDQGIWFCAFAEGRKQVQAAPLQAGFPKDIVRSLVPDTRGNIWIGLYDRAPLQYRAGSGQITAIAADWSLGVVTALEPASDNEVWVATENKGLIRFNRQGGFTWTAETFLPDLSSARISALHADAEMNLWIGSHSGLQSANLLFSSLEGSPGNAQAVLRTSDGSFLVGTEQGLFAYRLGTQQSTRVALPAQLNIVSLAEDPYGNIWIGTFGDYIYVYKWRSHRLRRIDKKLGLDNGSILSLYCQGKRMWMATLGGVFSVDIPRDPLQGGTPSVSNFYAEEALGTNFVYQVTGDSKGQVWFATDGNGIASFGNGKITQYPAARNAETKTVYSLCVTPDGHVWMGTAKYGLYEFDGQHLLAHGTQSGLRNTSIASVIADQTGRILVLHSEGIDIYDPRSKRFSYYDEQSGLGRMRPNINAFSIDSSQIWLGAADGLLRYQGTPPDAGHGCKPRIGLLEVLVMQEPVLGTGDTVFQYQQNYLSFHYQGSWYSNPSLIRYRYRILGLDKAWKYTREMEVSYSNLPAGDYHFQVEASINNSFEGAESASYRFRIKPPFYATEAFIAAVLILLGAIFYFWIRHRDRQAARQAQRHRERVEFQFNSLKNQVNPHFLFNSFNTLIALIEENPESAVHYVENLSDFYRSILQYGETDLIPLEEEIELLGHFVFLLQHRYGANLQVRIEIADPGGYVAPLALQMLVENAIKHNIVSAAHPLLVQISDRGDRLLVRNTLQRKLKPERSTGIGLQNIISRYSLLGAEAVEVIETEAYFEVSIPRIRHSESAHLSLFA